MLARNLDVADAFAELCQWAGRPRASGSAPRARLRPREVYDYVEEGGKLLFQVVRFEDKSFRQRRPDGRGGWIWKLDDTRRVLYQLPRMMEAVQGWQEDLDRRGREGRSRARGRG